MESFLGDYVLGKFIKHKEKIGGRECFSPANLVDKIGDYEFSYSGVELAISAAESNRVTWQNLGLKSRVQKILELNKSFIEIAQKNIPLIARETGRPIWEIQLEIKECGESIESACRGSDLLLDGFESEDESSKHIPIGTVVVIGPYCLPYRDVLIPAVYALLAGNTVVIKPSEKIPFSSQLLALAFDKAAVPTGVVSLVQGDSEVGRRLVVHEKVGAVYFTGSSEVGNRIRQDTLLQTSKKLALNLGAKNPAILFADGYSEEALYEILVGAFLSSGQRVTSTSRVLVERKIAEQFVENFHKHAKGFEIGHPLKEPEPFYGPLVDQTTLDRYLKFLGIAQREGFEMVMRGKALDLTEKGFYVSPSICFHKTPTLDATKKSVFQQTEIFAPSIAIIPFDHLEEACQQASNSSYGYCASVFTKDRAVFQKTSELLDYGLTIWNANTHAHPKNVGFVPGKKSSNQFIVGNKALLEFTTTRSKIENSAPRLLEQRALFPGINWIKN